MEGDVQFPRIVGRPETSCFFHGRVVPSDFNHVENEDGDEEDVFEGEEAEGCALEGGLPARVAGVEVGADIEDHGCEGLRL